MSDLIRVVMSCPITGKIMNDPVFAADGFVYERANIERWVSTNELVSPVTQEYLTHSVMTPAKLISSVISAAKAPPPPPPPPPRGKTTVLVPKLCIGAIIGAKGKTIHMIQKRTNTSIDIDQRADPCVVSVQGDDVDAAAVWVAKICDRVMRVMRVMNEALE